MALIYRKENEKKSLQFIYKGVLGEGGRFKLSTQ